MKRRISSGWELELLQRHIDELFEVLANPAPAQPAAWSPAVDVLEFPDRFVVRVDLPGVASRDIDVHLHERELHIGGSKDTHTGSVEGRRCHLMERGFGQFSVEILLPGPIRADRTRATLCDGVLEVQVPRQTDRRKVVQPHTVAVEEP